VAGGLARPDCAARESVNFWQRFRCLTETINQNGSGGAPWQARSVVLSATVAGNVSRQTANPAHVRHTLPREIVAVLRGTVPFAYRGENGVVAPCTVTRNLDTSGPHRPPCAPRRTRITYAAGCCTPQKCTAGTIFLRSWFQCGHNDGCGMGQFSAVPAVAAALVGPSPGEKTVFPSFRAGCAGTDLRLNWNGCVGVHALACEPRGCAPPAR